MQTHLKCDFNCRIKTKQPDSHKAFAQDKNKHLKNLNSHEEQKNHATASCLLACLPIFRKSSLDAKQSWLKSYSKFLFS